MFVKTHVGTDLDTECNTCIHVHVYSVASFPADSVNFCLFPELFLFPVLPIIPEIIREQ